MNNLILKDTNSKFFHVLANIRRRKKQIAALKFGNFVCQDVPSLKQEVENYVRNHFAKGNNPTIRLPYGEMKKINREDALKLEIFPDLEEVKAAVWSCGQDKALGFDGFNFRFFREMWEEIHGELFEFVRHFFETGVFPECLNITWVTLIP